MNDWSPDKKAEEKKGGRKPYEKPCLHRIDLAAEEIMGGCKNAPSNPGPLQAECTFCGGTIAGS